MYRHGDVILIGIKKPTATGEKEKDLILAYGEISGHSHRITKGRAKLWTFDNKRYLEIQSKLATLAHEEHEALEIPKGWYEIIIQREYTPEGWTYVRD